MANSLVPWLFLRPMDANHSGPRRRMVGETATVSTLVTAEWRASGGSEEAGAWALDRAHPAAWRAMRGAAGPGCRLGRTAGPRQAARRHTCGGAAVEAHVGGEGRLEARLALLALQRLDQRRLLACGPGSRTQAQLVRASRATPHGARGDGRVPQLAAAGRPADAVPDLNLSRAARQQQGRARPTARALPCSALPGPPWRIASAASAAGPGSTRGPGGTHRRCMRPRPSGC